eukprot:CAMPEP_0175177808 /NCGR_PEP_ID=MMETSP0087-20121206/34596_1 /TAXON_ID=136419 /ORGANISM="Unknown Unknown, Strain D1" /LENGTH=517 /DNA_ID=CAMNT_0016469835 /DNA_START=15 /DNA_END=1568 /DNA_ORIENTATION=-
MSEPPAKKPKVLSDEVKAAMASGNINISKEDAEIMELSSGSKEAASKHTTLLKQVEAMRRARTITVPTNDTLVRRKLREVGHPITLFGERAPGRRERLRAILARLAVEQADVYEKLMKMPGQQEQKQVAENKPVLYEGSKEVEACRSKIAHFSLPLARARIAMQRRKRQDPKPGEEEADIRAVQTTERTLKKFANLSSEIGDNRPISCCHFQSGGKYLATGSWSGYSKVFSIPDGVHTHTFRSHDDDRICDIAFHPHSGISQQPSAVNVATSDANGNVYLWPLPAPPVRDKGEAELKIPITDPIACLSGQKDRSSRIAFHPCGDYLASASYDKTWRLWDVNAQKAVLIQRGHSRAVYGLAIQGDGSLLASGDLGGNARLWDLRTGKAILPLKGHSKQVLCMDFHPNGYQLMTGGGDNTVRIWDLRKKGTIYTIPGHTKLISNLKWQPEHGRFLVSSSYDGTAKMWSAADYQLLKVLAGHEGQVMRVDVTTDSSYVATASMDRTWKLWAFDDSIEETY